MPSFLPAVSYPVIEEPQITAVGDFNGDGIPDLAVTNYSSHGNGSVSVLLGNGDGSFRSAVSYLTGGSEPIGIAAGEFRTGSGVLDLVIANSGSNTLSLLRGNGDGTFQGPVTMGRFSRPLIVKAGDFNGDGNLDLVVTNELSNTVSVLLGNGDDTFQIPVNYTVFSNPRDVIAADVRGIGVLDLVVTSENGSNIMVLLGNGDGTFQAPASYFGGDPADVAAGVFRTDSGVLDLAVTNRNGNTVSVLLGNGDGTFQPPVTYLVGATGNFPAINVGDFDQDGNLDLVATNQGGSTLSVLLGNGDGSFQTAKNYAAGLNPQRVSVVDLDGDGYPDLAVNNNASNHVSILLNDQNWGTSPGGRAREALSKPTPSADALPGVGVLGLALVASLPSTSPGHLQAAAPAKVFAAGYTGGATFSTSDPDPGVVLPADYTFTLADGGVHTFTDTGLGETTLLTRGLQTVTVTDTADDSIMGSATVKVRHRRHHDGGSPDVRVGQDSAAADRFFAALGSEDFGFLLPSNHQRQGEWSVE